MPNVYLRAATAEDETAIRRMIRAARLNPFGLHWPRFVVAAAVDPYAGEQIVGTGQVKILGDGTRELASLAVVPALQHSGIGRAIVWTLIDRTPAPIYLRCGSHNEGYYQRFGFRTLVETEMPRALRRVYGAANLVIGPLSALTGSSERLLVMGRP
jgi:N-acetylglutamate synthase-like GNAT family acetyltransferase